MQSISILLLIMANSMLLLFLFMGISTAALLLENPDFESPPTNITSNNSSNPLLLQNGINKLPGWSFSGSVWYVTAGLNLSLPGNNVHGLMLGQDHGKINQTFKADYNDYVLTFTLAPGSKECSHNTTVAVNVSTARRSKVFSLERYYGNEMWESHAFYFENSDNVINLEIQGVSHMETQTNNICSPVVDTCIINAIESTIKYGDNLVVNGGFEVGPSFVKTSSEGILLNEVPDQLSSPLQQWSIIGTVKYIDSTHYSVPEGKAAIEIVSNDPSGILTILELSKGSNYTLEFTMGDANDSCIGDLLLQAQVGRTIQNFTLQSQGSGATQNHSISFKAESSLSTISFVSLNQGKTGDGILCGPVIDNVMLRSVSLSNESSTPKLHTQTLLVLFIVTVYILQCTII